MRCVWVSVAILAATIALFFIRAFDTPLADLSVGAFFGVAAIVWLGAVLGTITSEYPAGDAMLMARVGLATFCRTAPLMVVVLVGLNYSTLLQSAALTIAPLYLVGMLTSVSLEVRRLKLTREQ